MFGFILFSSLEVFFSYRESFFQKKHRWPSHFGMIFIGSLIVKFMLPGGLSLVSQYGSENNLGLFNFFEISFFLEIILSILLLDLAIYIQHFFSHKIDFLWKIHRVHHSDIQLDATSALRFHPIEIILSVIYKVLLVLILGLSIEAILIFEIILNFMAMFNHSNLYIPKSLESVIRKFFVTPQMHIIHHSIEQVESDTNFGFNFSFWDRIFKTYTEKFSSKGTIGNSRFRDQRDNDLVNLLKQPFD